MALKNTDYWGTDSSGKSRYNADNYRNALSSGWHKLWSNFGFQDNDAGQKQREKQIKALQEWNGGKGWTSLRGHDQDSWDYDDYLDMKELQDNLGGKVHSNMTGDYSLTDENQNWTPVGDFFTGLVGGAIDDMASNRKSAEQALNAYGDILPELIRDDVTLDSDEHGNIYDIDKLDSVMRTIGDERVQNYGGINKDLTDKEWEQIGIDRLYDENGNLRDDLMASGRYETDDLIGDFLLTGGSQGGYNTQLGNNDAAYLPRAILEAFNLIGPGGVIRHAARGVSMAPALFGIGNEISSAARGLKGLANATRQAKTLEAAGVKAEAAREIVRSGILEDAMKQAEKVANSGFGKSLNPLRNAHVVVGDGANIGGKGASEIGKIYTDMLRGMKENGSTGSLFDLYKASRAAAKTGNMARRADKFIGAETRSLAKGFETMPEAVKQALQGTNPELYAQLEKGLAGVGKSAKAAEQAAPAVENAAAAAANASKAVDFGSKTAEEAGKVKNMVNGKLPELEDDVWDVIKNAGKDKDFLEARKVEGFDPVAWLRQTFPESFSAGETAEAAASGAANAGKVAGAEKVAEGVAKAGEAAEATEKATKLPSAAIKALKALGLGGAIVGPTAMITAAAASSSDNEQSNNGSSSNADLFTYQDLLDSYGDGEPINVDGYIAWQPADGSDPFWVKIDGQKISIDEADYVFDIGTWPNA